MNKKKAIIGVIVLINIAMMLGSYILSNGNTLWAFHTWLILIFLSLLGIKFTPC